MKIKKIISLIMVGVMGVLFAGCDKNIVKDNEKKIGYEKVSNNLYESTINSLVVTDSLNRSFGESSVYNSEKEVGIFYWVWHGYHTNGIYNVTDLLKNNSKEVWKVDSTIAPVNKMYYWDEPLYGYYSSDDPYVIKKHLELFTMSGIDYVGLDLTNLSTYTSTVKAVADEIIRLQELGWKPPKILPIFGEQDASMSNIPIFYEEMYKNKKYDSAWYRDKENGKPVISFDAKKSFTLDTEILSYFSGRNTVWPYQHKKVDDELNDTDFSWLDWAYPQHITPDTGRINVSVAQHPAYAFSKSKNPDFEATNYNSNRGRGWNYKLEENDSDKVLQGLNFENQWQTAHKNRELVKEVFVTGWNEWIATKHLGTDYFVREPNDVGKVAFVDQFNLEFSRDCEMMKGGYGDNFYLQNMLNVRKFKNPIETKFLGAVGTPSLTGSFENSRTYLDFSGEVIERNFRNADGSENYVNKTNRNDVTSINVMNDNEFLYIKINTLDDIVFDYEKDNNLNIFLAVKGVDLNSWNGYNYVINRTACKKGNSSSSLDTFSVNQEYKFNKASEVDSYLDGKVFAVKIPLKALGIINSNEFTIDFKVADNIGDPSNIMNYYVDGESAPIGRLSYRYNAG